VINALAEKDLLEFLDQCINRGRIPRMNPLLLLERGMKYRLATISEAPLVVAGQRLNKRIINLLRNHPSTEYSFSGEKSTPRPIRKGVHAFSRLKNLEFVSTDLTAASDYIPHEIAQAVWKGIWEAIGEEFPKHYETVGYVLLGPMMLAKEYLTDAQERPLWDVVDKMTTRGILMGLALTWPVLSILNLFGAEMAMNQYAREHEEFNHLRRNHKAYRPFVICGDDMAAAWPRPVTDLYFNQLENRLGLKISRKKTYLSPFGFIFVEKLFLVTGTMEVSSKDRPQKGVKTRLTLMEFLPPHLQGDEKISIETVEILPRPLMSAIVLAKQWGQKLDEKAPEWKKLPSIHNGEYLNAQKDWQKERIFPIMERIHPKPIRMLRGTQLPLHWPVALGGWGFYGKQNAPAVFRKAAAKVLTMSPEKRDEIYQEMHQIHATNGLDKLLKNTIVRTMKTLNVMAPNQDAEMYRNTKDEDRLGSTLQDELKAFARQGREVTFEPSKYGFATVSDTMAEVVQRVTTYHSLNPQFSKIKENSKPVIGRISKQVLKTIQRESSEWGSAKPINPNNIDQFFDEKSLSTLIPVDQLDTVLHMQGIQDRNLSRMLQSLRVGQRLNLYKFDEEVIGDAPEDSDEEALRKDIYARKESWRQKFLDNYYKKVAEVDKQLTANSISTLSQSPQKGDISISKKGTRKRQDNHLPSPKLKNKTIKKAKNCTLWQNTYNTARKGLAHASKFLDEKLPYPYKCETQTGGSPPHKKTIKRRIPQNRTRKVRSPVVTRSKSSTEPGGKEIKP
jgi:hypothetical protein